MNGIRKKNFKILALLPETTDPGLCGTPDIIIKVHANSMHGIIIDRVGLVPVIPEDGEMRAIKAVESVERGDPHKTIPVPGYTIDKIIA